jgi:hypothetical protein
MAVNDPSIPQGEAGAEQQLPNRPPGEAEDELYMAAVTDRHVASPLPEDATALDSEPPEQK